MIPLDGDTRHGVDISPATLVSLDPGRTGAAMGGALTGDIFFNGNFALRTTFGFSKDRYYPEDLNYSDADYGFWMSIAPYGEIQIARGLIRPYAAVLGSFSTGGNRAANIRSSIISPQAPASRLPVAATRDNAYSFGATLGSKFRVAGPVSLYAEVTHFFFTSFLQTNPTTLNSVPDITFNYDFDDNPTYLSIGLTYTFSLKRK
jgi:hypothetical protein